MRISDWSSDVCSSDLVHVAQYYYERGAYVAAVNRAQTVITDFQGVPIAEKALYIIYLSYDKLGLTELRDDAKRVLDQNFPNSKYYEQGLDEPGGSYWNPINWFYNHCAWPARSEERRGGKECGVRVDHGGRRSIKKKQTRQKID